jgi:hypothetical protein
MDRTRTLRRTLDLKFRGRELWDDLKHDSARYQKTSRREERPSKKSERNDCGKMERLKTFFPSAHIEGNDAR